MGLKMLQRSSQEDVQSMEASEHEYSGQPVSPISQSLRSSILSLCINAVLELEQTMIFPQVYAFANALSTGNPLFSCIMEDDDEGVVRWQKTKVNIDDHIIIIDDVDAAWVDGYINKLSLKPLNISRPLWEYHVLNHKTSGTGATMILRFHHSLGDGISLMSLLFSVVTRVDNPHLRPTFPTSANPKAKSEPASSIKHSAATKISDRWSAFTAKYFQMRAFYILVVGWFILVDVITTSLRLWGWIADNKLQPVPAASCVDQDQLYPVELSSATFQLEDIKQIKKCVGGTVNDVLTGVIFYGMQRYLMIHLSAVGEQTSLKDAYEKRFELPQVTRILKQMKNLRVTALCAMNTRSSPGLQNIDEMLKSKSTAQWGNQVYYVPVRIPFSSEKLANPLEFVKRAKAILDRQKIIAGSLRGSFLRFVARLKGPQEFSKYVRNAIASSTMRISNMVGPMEKIAISGNPVKTFSFFVSGGQGTQFLAIYILSYMGTVTMQVKVQSAYADPKVLSSCLMEAFKEMKEASIVHKLVT